MRILVRTSKWAIWARRLGSFALPLVVVPVFLHRQGMLDSNGFAFVEGLAVLMALAAVVLAVGAFVRLWITGDQGWWRAALGLFFALIALMPAVLGAYLFVRYPGVVDVSTDLRNPPPLTRPALNRRLDAELVARVAAAFPNAASRSYPLGPQQVFAIAADLAVARGWDIRRENPPQTPLGEGQLNAVETTLLGWRDEVSIRVTGGPTGATVAMRSASQGGWHDLGQNGMRIEDFLLALDTEVTTEMRDLPLDGQTDEAPAPAVGAD